MQDQKRFTSEVNFLKYQIFNLYLTTGFYNGAIYLSTMKWRAY